MLETIWYHIYMKANVEKLKDFKNYLTSDEELFVLSAVMPTITNLFHYDNSNKTAIQYFRENIKSSNDKRVFEKCFNIAISCMLKEIFVLEKESFQSSGGLLNEATLARDEELKKIRNSLPENMARSMNNRELYKTLRDSLVHNSDKDPNTVIDKDGDLYIRIQLKDGSKAVVNCNTNFVFTIANSFARNQSESVKYTYEVEVQNILNHLKEDGIDETNVARFVRIFLNGEKERLDIRQKRAISNYINNRITKCKTIDDFHYYMGESFGRHLPLKSNTDNLFIGKMDLVLAMLILKENPNYTKKDLLRKVKELFSREGENNKRMEIDINQSSDLIFPSMTSVAFQIFSERTNDELKDLFDAKDVNLSSEQTRRLRNSLMHGRYYFDFDNNVEFYDGQKIKNLEHQLTMSAKEFVDLFDKVTQHIKLQFKTEIDTNLLS